MFPCEKKSEDTSKAGSAGTSLTIRGTPSRNIRAKIPATDIQFLSIFDLYLTNRFTIQSKDISIASLITEQYPENVANDRPNILTSPRRSEPPVAKQSSTAYNSNELELYRNLVLDKLNDSVRTEYLNISSTLLTLHSWLTLVQSIESC